MCQVWCSSIQCIYAWLTRGTSAGRSWVDLPNLSSRMFRCAHQKGLFASHKTKQQVCSNFQMRCTLRWAAPPWNCQWQQITYFLIYVINENPFKMVGRIRSSFQMRCTLWWNDPPIVSDDLSPGRIRSSFQMTCTQAELGHLFRWPVSSPVEASGGKEEYYIRSSWPCNICKWGVASDDLSPGRIRSSFQMTCTQAELGHLFRWPVSSPVEASGGKEEYYIRSSWPCNICKWGVASDELPPPIHHRSVNTFTPHKFWPPPPPIDHTSLEYHYTTSVSYIAVCTYTQGRCPPTPIDHRSVEYHYTT